MLDAVYYAHHAQRSRADRRGYVHGRGNFEQHFADLICARTHGRGNGTGEGRS